MAEMTCSFTFVANDTAFEGWRFHVTCGEETVVTREFAVVAS